MSQSPCPTAQGQFLEQQLQSVKESQGGFVVAGSTQHLKSTVGTLDGQALPLQIKFPLQSELELQSPSPASH